MARAPGSKGAIPDKKSKSSASESSRGAAAGKPKTGKIDKVKSAAAATTNTGSSKSATIPDGVKSVLKESRPASTVAVEQDFPRGAAPKAARAPVTAKPVVEEQGLFKVSWWALLLAGKYTKALSDRMVYLDPRMRLGQLRKSAEILQMVPHLQTPPLPARRNLQRSAR
jgi:hypothetical protein